ncbi:LysM peptidoglycan-binding domain-containing protein [Kitasatospora sp. NPDC001132]
MSVIGNLISIAKGEIGYREGFSGGHWNNDQKYSKEVPGLEWSNFQPWCQTFQSWIFRQAGIASLAPVTASCLTAVDWFKSRGRFSDYPAVGAQVFFGSGGGSHVEVVESYDADYVYTIGGNTNNNGSAEGNGVYARKRARRDSYLYGYGYPAYDGGSVSADPNAAKFGYRTKSTGSVADVGGSTGGGSNSGTYTVVSGDTLSGIGAKLGIDWTKLAAANGIVSPYVINVGQKLNIPGAGGTYTVVSGDTLSGIGAKTGINWQSIASANGIGSPYVINPGQVLRLP